MKTPKKDSAQVKKPTDSWKKLGMDAARMNCMIFYAIDTGSMRCSENKCVPCRAKALRRTASRKRKKVSRGA